MIHVFFKPRTQIIHFASNFKHPDMPQNTKVELTRELIKALLNESRQNAFITPHSLPPYTNASSTSSMKTLRRTSAKAVTDAQNAADAAEEALRKISEFASSRLVCNFRKHAHLSGTERNRTLIGCRPEKVSEVKIRHRRRRKHRRKR